MPKYEIGFTVEAPNLSIALRQILLNGHGVPHTSVIEIQYANQKEED